MVWGMTLPENFGEFWPLGDFEYDPVKQKSGWSSRLNVYYFQQSPEVQTELGAGRIMVGDYGFYVCGKFKNEMGSTIGNDPPLSLIQANEPPQSFDTEKGYKALGSLIAMNSMLLAVDETLKTIIERLEPGIHKFYPIVIKMPRGKVYPKNYYTLVVGQYFDAFSLEETELGSAFERAYGFFKPDPSKAGLNGLAVRKEAFGSAHLWRDRSFKAELTCFSDELKTEIDNAGLRLPKHNKMKEV
jgi:hypothetical protein